MQLNPRGVFASVNVIMSFHPLFITKVDRSVRVQVNKYFENRKIE